MARKVADGTSIVFGMLGITSPIGRDAVNVRALRERHALTGNNRYLFSNQRDHEKPMSNGAILMALRWE
jgi:hypothetical protein